VSAPFVYVMGPSGAGKDSVLARARALISPDLPVAFAHRYITRPADAGGENHVALSEFEFERYRALGLFVFHWSAHGFRYGIGVEADVWRRAGLVTVVSGSREHFATLDARALRAIPVLITASPASLEARLRTRGREASSGVSARLARATAIDIRPAGLITIVNDGVLDDAAQALITLLATPLP
jgi:ribose 1,5-bisphosphokinase